jgi:hypothetical protein
LVVVVVVGEVRLGGLNVDEEGNADLGDGWEVGFCGGEEGAAALGEVRSRSEIEGLRTVGFGKGVGVERVEEEDEDEEGGGARTPW